MCTLPNLEFNSKKGKKIYLIDINVSIFKNHQKAKIQSPYIVVDYKDMQISNIAIEYLCKN